MKSRNWLVQLICTAVVAAAAGTGAALTASAQEGEAVTSVDVAAFTCRDLIRLSSERDNVVIFMHGYVSGKMGETVIDIPALTAASDAVVEYCIDNPEAPALTAFMDNR